MRFDRRIICAAILAALAGCGGGDPEPEMLALKSELVATTTAPPPAIFVHGGGWHSGDPNDVSHLAPRFAAWGFPLDTAVYRFVPEHPMGTEVADVQAEIARVRATNPRGPMIVVGHSAGAHLAATAVLDTGSERRVCLVLLDGVGYDLQTFLIGRPNMQVRLGLTPETAAPWSPTALLNATHPVRIFVASGNDYRDTKGQAEALAAAAQSLGMRAEHHHYPDMDHTDFMTAFKRPASDFTMAVARFLRSCTGYRPE